MTSHNLFYYPYASFTNAQLPLAKVAALWFDRLAILDPIGASWDTVGADYVARDAVTHAKEADTLVDVTGPVFWRNTKGRSPNPRGTTWAMRRTKAVGSNWALATRRDEGGVGS